MPKELWPSMRFGPDNSYCIFEGPDEIPEGWTDSLKQRKDFDPDKPLVKVEAAVAPAEFIPAPADIPPPVGLDLTPAVTEEQVKQFEADYLNKDMIAMLEIMQELDDNIEFSKKWPGAKLARCILENGGPPEGFEAAQD